MPVPFLRLRNVKIATAAPGTPRATARQAKMGPKMMGPDQGLEVSDGFVDVDVDWRVWFMSF